MATTDATSDDPTQEHRIDDADATAEEETEPTDTACQHRARRAHEEDMDVSLRRQGGIYEVESESGNVYEVEVDRDFSIVGPSSSEQDDTCAEHVALWTGCSAGDRFKISPILSGQDNRDWGRAC